VRALARIASNDYHELPKDRQQAEAKTSPPAACCIWLERTMRFPVTLDRDEDGVWIVECPSIPGCVSQGKTKETALKNIRDAIKLCIDVRAEQGLPLTVETQQVEVAM
jgi:predicted RNase H-like HicB family nuclease